ncbi:NTP transferase domain-containing protein [Virgibacillus soli]|uniref:NTP transferase domain-containing protein n=1 Tax=Paracerasibacillus soli TaxID=480284 RepID=A0ABU5CP95_9BACI|nr:NTP transferase domain-containing protein [Virgibacillus soli]MDY0407711.1 NTP transferase domain-containing protein [Virgibacillus soli]
MKPGKIVGIYLAAGNSSRFGSNKLEQILHGQALGSIALKTALQSKLDQIIVVTKPKDKLDWITQQFQSLYKNKLIITSCKRAQDGQAYSLMCGLKKSEQLGAQAIVVLLADQPFIASTMIDGLIKQFVQAVEIPFIASSIKGIFHPPILFHKKIFPLLLAELSGDRGAHYFIKKHLHDGKFIHYTNPVPFIDIDTKEDFECICLIE